MSTRALQRAQPCPRHFNVIVPAPVSEAALPFSKFPLNPGAAILQMGGGAVGMSETVATQVIVAAPVIVAVSGCCTPLSKLACMERTVPRRARCASPGIASSRIAAANTQKRALCFEIISPLHKALRNLHPPALVRQHHVALPQTSRPRATGQANSRRKFLVANFETLGIYSRAFGVSSTRRSLPVFRFVADQEAVQVKPGKRTSWAELMQSVAY